MISKGQGRKLKRKLAIMLYLPWAFGILLLVLSTGLWLETPLRAEITVILAMLLLVGAVWSFRVVQKLSKSLAYIETSVVGLSAGSISANGQATVVQEFEVVSQALEQLKNDLRQKTVFTEKLSIGHLDTAYEISNDNDKLGVALVNIQKHLRHIREDDEQRKWASDGLTRFVDILQSAEDVKALSQNIIVNLVKIINANQGALYLLSDENGKQVLNMEACYAFDRFKHLVQKFEPGEGLLGQAFLEGETVYLKNVPENFIRITSGLGEANPRDVLIVPLRLNESVVGIMELASFQSFSQHVIDFVEKIGENIAHSVSTYRSSEMTRLMLEESRAQAEEMRAQEEELRQNQEELQATQETISRKYDALFSKLTELNHQSKFEQLKSITSTKKRNVEYYFDIIRNQIVSFSEDFMIIQAIRDLKAGFYQMNNETSIEQLTAVRQRVASYYDAEFITRLNDYVNMDLSADSYLPSDPRILILQDLYIASNPHPTGSKSALDFAPDNSSYSLSHSRYHPIFRNYLERFGYYDIFLIDAKTGDMLYSVFKEVDFATNLLTGEYSKTNFGRVVQNAVESTDKKFVKLIDFEPYDPSYHAPASFIASAVYDGDEKIGILVFQMPIQKINQILTGNNSWREDGLGATGETVIVGSDNKLRSVSRQILENPAAHIESLRDRGYSPSILQQIKKMQTSILMEEVRMLAVKNALSGETGTTLENNGNKKTVLTAYAPVKIPDVQWVILSSMEETEALAMIKDLRNEVTA